MDTSRQYAILFAILTFIHVTHGYPSGVPPNACDAMIPGHGVSAQTGTSTYTIGVPSVYTCDSTVTVTLSGTPGFKGFFCQARTGANSNSRLGTFSIGSNTNMNLGCSSQAVTHNSNVTKTSVEFTWTPTTNHGDVYIVCTWVQTTSTFWVKETSSALSFSGNATTCDTNTANHVTSSWLPIFIMAATVPLSFIYM